MKAPGSALDGIMAGGTGKVRRKSNNTQKLLTDAKRIVSKSKGGAGAQPEVMVKVTGFGKGGGHATAHLTYISRHGKLEIETDRGEIIKGRAGVLALAGEWAEDFGDTKSRKAKRDTIHIVLSMANGTDAESVRSAVRAFAKETFGKNHEYAFALHTDQDHPHCHLTVKYRGFDGKTVKSDKDDLQRWRETFATHLRKLGVDAAATPRVVRGVVRKSEAQVLRHIVADEPKRPARESTVRTKWIHEARDAVIAESRLKAKDEKAELPLSAWEARILVQREKAKDAWLEAARDLEAQKPLSYKNQKATNDRPDYASNDPNRRAIQRAAYLYQSDLGNNVRREPPQAITSMRNVSGSPLVWDRNDAEMLLSTNALNHMDKGGAAGSPVRRPGAGPSGVDGAVDETVGKGRPVTYTPGVSENKELAAQIREFVKTMPTAQTRHRLRMAQLKAGADLESKIGPKRVPPNGGGSTKPPAKGPEPSSPVRSPNDRGHER